MKKFTLTFPRYQGEITFAYDDNDLLSGIAFGGNHPEWMKSAVLKTLPMTVQKLLNVNWRDGILTEEAEKVTFQMFWDRYADKARSSKVKTERVWNRMPEGERVKAYRYVNRYKSAIPQGVCMKYAATYLNDQMWNN